MARGTPFEVIVYRDDQPAALPRMGGSAGWGETDQQCYVPLRAGRPANPGRDRRRLVWRGQARCSVIVAEGERWNDVVFVEYPSRRDLERWLPTSCAAAPVSSPRTPCFGSSSSSRSERSRGGSGGHRGSASRWGSQHAWRRRGATPRCSSSRRPSSAGTRQVSRLLAPTLSA